MHIGQFEYALSNAYVVGIGSVMMSILPMYLKNLHWESKFQKHYLGAYMLIITSHVVGFMIGHG